MRRIGWLALTALFFALTAGIGAKTAILDLRGEREWDLTDTGPAGGALEGVALRVELTRAATAPQRPDRALLLVRLALDGPPAARAAWVDCRVTLRHGQDRLWRPLETANTDAAIRTIAPDGQNMGRCNPQPFDAPADAGPILSDQVFLVPVEALDGLRLHVSAQGTRPRALALPIAAQLVAIP
ncbi:hypothetical protein [Paracoccus siganidrum]|uniref:Uncharacterized protein n=1 Tax=Paracoccus siganidrum TaxID=1276757 RepID=A0A419ACN3_9RHOB|nr:hypothetical protein [Paracoccus siganidrum]RJL22670.1 hypothetical protein D3P05_00300 [Paracoccus siganidrum]RMC39677.1 hypothetical protein C9E82_03420 [Paracoccus siganidrum]